MKHINIICDLEDKLERVERYSIDMHRDTGCCFYLSSFGEHENEREILIQKAARLSSYFENEYIVISDPMNIKNPYWNDIDLVTAPLKFMSKLEPNIGNSLMLIPSHSPYLGIDRILAAVAIDEAKKFNQIQWDLFGKLELNSLILTDLKETESINKYISLSRQFLRSILDHDLGAQIQQSVLEFDPDVIILSQSRWLQLLQLEEIEHSIAESSIPILVLASPSSYSLRKKKLA